MIMIGAYATFVDAVGDQLRDARCDRLVPGGRRAGGIPGRRAGRAWLWSAA